MERRGVVISLGSCRHFFREGSCTTVSRLTEIIRVCHVHIVNTDRIPSTQDHFRSLQILDELAKNDSVTQRDLSNRLGIALGLVNSYVKNLVAKGYITVKAIPPKRYGYYLTPKGFMEKTRLACDLLQDYTRIYREAKSNYRTIFHALENAGTTRIIFAGVDEVAEFAFITMQETGLQLIGMIDTERVGEKFFEFIIIFQSFPGEVKEVFNECREQFSSFIGPIGKFFLYLIKGTRNSRPDYIDAA